jgi:hypothetical protein
MRSGRKEKDLDAEVLLTEHMRFALALRELRMSRSTPPPTYTTLAQITARLASSPDTKVERKMREYSVETLFKTSSPGAGAKAEKKIRAYSPAALSKAADGKTVPTRELVSAYIAACDGVRPVSTTELKAILTAYGNMVRAPKPVGKQVKSEAAPEYRVPLGGSTPKLFNDHLLLLKARRGLSYEQIERAGNRLGYRLPHTSVSTGLRLGRVPSLEQLKALLHVLGVAPGDAQKPWIEAWKTLFDEPARADQTPSTSAYGSGEVKLAEQLIVSLGDDGRKAEGTIRGIAAEYPLQRLATLADALEAHDAAAANRLLRAVCRRPSAEVIAFVPLATTLRQKLVVVREVAGRWTEVELARLYTKVSGNTIDLNVAARLIFEAKAGTPGAIRRIIDYSVALGARREPLTSVAMTYEVFNAPVRESEPVRERPDMVLQPVTYVAGHVAALLDAGSRKQAVDFVNLAATRRDGVEAANLYCALTHAGMQEPARWLYEAVIASGERAKLIEFSRWLNQRGVELDVAVPAHT